MESKKGTSDSEDKSWKADHTSECSISHQRSSGKMEADRAKFVWERSQDKGACYTTPQ